jgi:hypothetical protein
LMLPVGTGHRRFDFVENLNKSKDVYLTNHFPKQLRLPFDVPIG